MLGDWANFDSGTEQSFNSKLRKIRLPRMVKYACLFSKAVENDDVREAIAGAFTKPDAIRSANEE